MPPTSPDQGTSVSKRSKVMVPSARTPLVLAPICNTLIAEQSKGDARVAIQTLRTAAYRADKGRGSQIRPEDIEEGLRSTSGFRRRYVLKGLSERHRLMYQLVEDAGVISTIELWKRYKTEARKHGLEPMSRRTFRHYKLQLIANRLLKERQGPGRRNVRYLTVIE